MYRALTTAFVLAVIVTACANGDATDDAPVTTTRSDAPTSSTQPTVTPDISVVATVPEAVALSLASNGEEPPMVAWTSQDGVRVASLDLDDRSLGEPTLVSGDTTPAAHPIERPAVAVRSDGVVEVAFTTHGESGGSVYHTALVDDVWATPELISGTPRPETNLVQAGLDPTGAVVMAWLEDSNLSVASPDSDGQLSEVELGDDQTCDCCNPAPIYAGETLLVPFRDHEIVDGEVVRDVAVVRSHDGGATFGSKTTIADDNWFIDGCPFTGPHAVTVDETLVVAFMDARQSVHPDQTDSSIWVDISTDDGATFGTDLQIAGEGINRWPVMAVDDHDVIYLIWEIQGPDGGLGLAQSGDAGRSFSEAQLVLANSDISGSARAPSVVYHQGSLVVTWTDADGGWVGTIGLG